MSYILFGMIKLNKIILEIKKYMVIFKKKELNKIIIYNVMWKIIYVYEKNKFWMNYRMFEKKRIKIF